MADRDELLSEFCRVTDAGPAEARSFLEGSGWNFDLALSNYFEEADDEPLGSSDEIMMEEEKQPQQPKPSQPCSSSRIVTMSSLIAKEDKSGEDGQAFYAGGSTRSGQQVLGPGSDKDKGRRMVAEMFKAAKGIGAQVVEPAENQCRVFGGRGYVLDSGSSSNATADIGTSGNNQCPTMCLRAWRTGFTVENGPLREYSDPKNVEFLDAVRKGKIPRELVSESKIDEVSFKIEDHSDEDYVPPQPIRRAFTGQGHRLGSPTPKVVSANENKQDLQKQEDEARRLLNVDQSQPVTVIQIRLADGSRLMVQLNHNHTVGNIREYLVVARPEYSASVFSLWRAYPPSELTDDVITIKDADLLNSVIVQKM